MAGSATGAVLRAWRPAAGAAARLVDAVPRAVVDDIFACALKKQTGVSLKYMLDFGANPIEKQLRLSAQFLHNELPVRLAHRVAELENLPYGLSAKAHVLKVSKKKEEGWEKGGKPRAAARFVLPFFPRPLTPLLSLSRSATGTSNPSPSCAPFPPSRTRPTSSPSPPCCAAFIGATSTPSLSWRWAWRS